MAETRANGLKRECILLGITGTIGFFILAALSFPIIVIADSDMGAGAKRNAHDALFLALTWAILAILASTPATRVWRIIRTAASAGILTWLVASKPLGDRLTLFHGAQLAYALATAMLFASIWAFHMPTAARLKWLAAVAVSLLATSVYATYCAGTIPLSTQTNHFAERQTAHGGPALEEVPQISPSSASMMAVNLRLDVTSADGALHVREDDSGNIVMEGPTSQAIINRPSPDDFQMVAFSPNSRLLATVEFDISSPRGMNLARIWTIQQDQGKKTLHVTNIREWRSQYIRAVAFAPDNDTVLLSCDDGVGFFSIRTGDLIRHFTPHMVQGWQKGSCPDCLAVSADGALLATWFNNDIKVWDYPSLALRRQFLSNDDVGCSLGFAGAGHQKLISVGRHWTQEWGISRSWTLLGLLTAGTAALTVMMAKMDRQNRDRNGGDRNGGDRNGGDRNGGDRNGDAPRK